MLFNHFLRLRNTAPGRQLSRLMLLASILSASLTVPAVAQERAIQKSPAQASKAAANAPPNVVLILGDDQRWTDFGFMGHEVIKTPNLDRLAREGATFPWGYVPDSLCRPSLMSIITGLYPHQHGITGNDPPRGMDRNLMLKHVRQAPTLPKLLKERGYVSFQSGKWWEGNPKEGGFDSGMTHGDVTRGGRHGDLGLKIGREGLEPIEKFLDGLAKSGEPRPPFFLWYAPFLPHEPHNPPERLLKKYSQPDRPEPIAKYYAMCEWFDETCGQLMTILDQRGLSENTLVIFVEDNGWIQKPDGRGYAPRSKRSPYDGGIRTPILVRWPGHITPGVRQTPISSIDIAPTVLAACGVKSKIELPGVNLLELCSRKESSRQALFGEIFEHDVPDIDDPAKGLLFRMVMSGGWKLILPHNSAAKVELYHLAIDPGEEKNLAAEEPERVQQLLALIDAWWKPK